VFGKGNPHNDYGLGFYCTESLDLAKEWACTEETNGYANRYEIDFSRLSVINLSVGGYNILNWLALLVNNRIFRISSDVAREGKQYLTEVFLPDISTADMIVGYPANDSYFSFANAFLNNTLSLEQLSRAMYLGEQRNPSPVTATTTVNARSIGRGGRWRITNGSLGAKLPPATFSILEMQHCPFLVCNFRYFNYATNSFCKLYHSAD
jgi:hypothetical protein